jgi:chemotaxis protein methyltransferase CheR
MTPHTATRAAGSSPDYVRFCTGVKTLTGIDLGQYRPAQMERRLRSFAERVGEPDLDAYLTRLRRDAGALDQFLDRMTINVSELFRNPERFADLERTIIPELLRASPGGLRVWSAGSSYGAEVYSLQILARELAPRARHEFLACDIDERVLARARKGRFGPQDMRNVTPERRRRWFAEEAGDDGVVWQAAEELRRGVTFRRMDLLKDPFPRGMHLIACRNVVIYFNDDAKDVLYRRFLEALAPGGILFVGSTERVNAAEEMGWEKAGTFFYRRPR